MAISHNAAAAALGVLLLGGVAVSGQNQAPPSDMATLLAEVKALRADIGQVAAASIRMQVLVARVSLQEQRIASVGRQLTEVETQLRTVTEEKATFEEKAKDMEEVIAHVRGQGKDTASAEDMREQLKREVEAKARLEQQLRLQTTELQNVLAVEQGRWSDFNNRLDELERSLQVR
jgi:septal ring factor EnvC (AmiA/AmiB activator)